MSKVDKRALRELAEKATPGPWIRAGDYKNKHGNLLYSHVGVPDNGLVADALSNCMVTSKKCRANANFIAAANPATVLTLLDEIEALRTCLAETAGVAVTMLYESHKADTLKEFSIEELSRMVDSTKHLSDANAQVEKIYRKAWDMAQGGTDHG